MGTIANNFLEPDAINIAQGISSPGDFSRADKGNGFAKIKHYDGKTRLAVNLDKIVEGVERNYQGNPTLLQRLVEWIKSMLSKVKTFIANIRGQKHLVAEASQGSPEFSQMDGLRNEIDAVLSTLLSYPGEKKEAIDRLLESNGAKDIFRFKIASLADLLAKSTDSYQSLRGDLDRRMQEVSNKHNLGADAIKTLFESGDSHERRFIDPAGDIAADIRRIDELHAAIDSKRAALGVLINSALTGKVMEVEDVHNLLSNYKVAIDPSWMSADFASNFEKEKPMEVANAPQVAPQKAMTMEEILASIPIEVAPMEGAELLPQEPKTMEELLADIPIEIAPMDDMLEEEGVVISASRPRAPGM